MKKTVNLPKFGRDVEVRSASYDEADNTVEVIWTTGAPVRRYSWRDGVYYNEILEVSDAAVRLDRLNAGAPFLNTHADSKLADVIGSVVPGSARIEGGVGYARVKLSSAPEDSAILGKIKDGIIRNVSVGYAIHKVEKTVNEKGGDEDWRVVDWEPMEISAVPIPADAGSQIRSSAETYACDMVECEVDHSPSATRARMVERQAAAFPGGLLNIARRNLQAGRICEDFLTSLTAAHAAARSHTDPVAAAEAAWDACDSNDREDRVAAYAAAFALAAGR